MIFYALSLRFNIRKSLCLVMIGLISVAEATVPPDSERYLFHACYRNEWISRSNPQRSAYRGARSRRQMA